MMSTYKPGQWNAICDICGFEFHSGKLNLDWRGLRVCEKDFELRNQQDFIRVRPERITPPWVRPEPPDLFLPQVCNLVNSQGIVGVGIAGCMIPNKITPGLI